MSVFGSLQSAGQNSPEPYFSRLGGSSVRGRDLLGLLDAVAGAPRDAFLRCLVADWLEEEGEAARSEFIRCQLARQDVPSWSQDAEDLASSAEWLYEANKAAWLVGLSPDGQVIWDRLDNFSGGLLERVTIREPTAPAELVRALRRIPLRGLKVATSCDVLELLDCVAQTQSMLDSLDLSATCLDWVDVSMLAISPVLSELKRLILRGNSRIGDAGVGALAYGPYLSNLKELDLGGTGLTAEGLHCLAGASLDSLTVLRLGHNRIDAQDAEVLACWPRLSGLTLDLRHAQIGEAALLTLAQSPYLTRTTSVDLRGVRLPKSGALARLRDKALVIDAAFLQARRATRKGRKTR